MLAAKAQVQQYLEQVNVYFDCENDALKLQEVSEQQRSVLDQYNAELRTFRAASRAAGMRPAVLRR